jgi:hypothetical protein
MAKLLFFVAAVPSRWRRPVTESRVLEFLTRDMLFTKAWCEYRYRKWLRDQPLAKQDGSPTGEQRPPA